MISRDLYLLKSLIGIFLKFQAMQTQLDGIDIALQRIAMNESETISTYNPKAVDSFGISESRDYAQLRRLRNREKRKPSNEILTSVLLVITILYCVFVMILILISGQICDKSS